MNLNYDREFVSEQNLNFFVIKIQFVGIIGFGIDVEQIGNANLMVCHLKMQFALIHDPLT